MTRKNTDVCAMADVTIVENVSLIVERKSPAGKAYMSVKFDNGVVINMSLTIAEMIGGVAAGTQQRLGYVMPAPERKQ